MKEQGKGKAIILVKYLTFILYLLMLVYVVLLKRGMALRIAAYARERYTWLDRLKNINYVPFSTISYYLFEEDNIRTALTQLLGNILAFCPMGFLVPSLIKKKNKLKSTLLTTALIGLIIEATQGIFILGSFDIDDLILYVIGGAIGYLAYIACEALIKFIRSSSQWKEEDVIIRRL